MRSDSYPPGTTRALLGTDMVTPQTRAALRERLEKETAAAPRFFDEEVFATLRAVCSCLIPQPERVHPIDLAGAVDERLAKGEGDGWRHDRLPSDGEAHCRGLRGLNESARGAFGMAFHELDAAHQNELLLAMQRGEVNGGVWEALSASRFFEELLAGVTECYYSHPLAQEEIGYAGMADAHGWQSVGLDQLEPWEPPASGDERG